MRVIVTGGAGFVGTHVTRAMVTAGHRVTVVDDLSTPSSRASADVEFQRVAIAEMHPRHLDGVGAIVHCAAHADISGNWAPGPAGTVARESLIEDVISTSILLELAPRGCTFVYLSTSAVYGDERRNCIEAAPCIATSPYAASKLSCEALVQAYARGKSLSWVTFRPGSIVGAGYHHGHIADFVRMHRETGEIRAKSAPIAKSHVHVLDVADACVAAVHAKLPNGIYNVSGGTWSWAHTTRLMGVDSVASHEPTHIGWTGDTHANLDASKLRKYIATDRSIESGVRDALASLGWAP